MPGLYGAVALLPGRDPAPVADAMERLLRHQPWYRHCAARDGKAALGAFSTDPAFSADTHLARQGEVRLLVEGVALTVDGVPVPPGPPGPARRLLDLYLADGDDFVRRLGGRFTLAIDDGRDGRLLLACDRMGFARLYWYLDDEVFLFGPEIKIALAWARADLTVDRASLATFLARECPYGSRTWLRRVSVLPEAGRLILQRGQATVDRYWIPTSRPETGRSRQDLADEAITLFSRSIEKRLPGKGPVVVPLSGGLDSRLLLHLVRDRGDDLLLFTHGQADCSEYLIARQVARTLGLEHRHRLVEIRPAWLGEHARLAVWLDEGEVNARNANLVGIDLEVGPGPVPFLNGILGPYLSIGTGHFCDEDDPVAIDDEQELRRRILRFSGVAQGSERFSEFLVDEAVAPLRRLAREQVWESFQDYRHLPLFGDQKMLHMHFNFGRRMQASVDVHRYFFHDLLPLVDEELFDLYLRIPLRDKIGNPIYLEMYRRHLPDLARVPWSRTGHDLFAPPAAVARTVARRRRRRRLQDLLRRLTRGRIDPRDRDQYLHRELWLRRDPTYREEVLGTLRDVGATGCDLFDQTKVDRLVAGLLRGKNWHFAPLMQIYSTVVWFDLFQRRRPAGAEPAVRGGPERPPPIRKE